MAIQHTPNPQTPKPMKNPLRTWQKTALAALLSVFAVGASAATSSVVPVATDPLATEDISALDAGDTLSSAWSTSASSIDDVASVEAAAIVLDTGDDSLTYTPTSGSSTAHAELSLTFSAATTAPAAPPTTAPPATTSGPRAPQRPQRPPKPPGSRSRRSSPTPPPPSPSPSRSTTRRASLNTPSAA